MEEALIGLVGVLLGIGFAEYFRRKSRLENYSTTVFEKRLGLYEQLFEKVSQYSAVATEVLENTTLTKEQRHELVSVAILDVAQFCDMHELYFDEEITVHCVPILMGVEDIPDMESEVEKESEIKRFRESLVAAKKMIRKEAGVTDLNKLFRSMIKPKHSSPIIEYYRARRKELGLPKD